MQLDRVAFKRCKQRYCYAAVSVSTSLSEPHNNSPPMPAFDYIEPRPGTTTPENVLQVVVIGQFPEPRTYGYRDWVALNIPHNHTAFPLSFLCSTAFNVRDTSSIGSFLRAIIDLPREQQVAGIDSLRRLESCAALHKRWKCWAVLNGKDGSEFIAFNWGDVYRLVHNQRQALCKRFDSLAAAIQFLILRGQDPEAAALRAADYNEFVASFRGMSTSDNESSAPSTPRHASTASSIHSATSSTLTTPSMPSTPSTPSTRSPPRVRSTMPSNVRSPRGGTAAFSPHSPSSAHGAIPSNAPSSGSGAATSSPRSSSHVRGAMPSNMPSRSSGATAFSQQGVRSATRQILTGTHGRIIFINQRDREGRFLTPLYDPPITIAGMRVPSLGEMLDEFVDAFGYGDAFIHLVYAGWVESMSAEDFSQRVSNILSVQEARWLWRWIDVPDNFATRVRNFNRE
ncbi:hypothetical protein BDW22DRAFT_1432481 [Trametopsis cervina]|nr:hypothetical protein BDW22DRAFT_1432481 [Trametopsis cervina]